MDDVGSQYLVDEDRGETPYRILEILDSGEGHQIVLAEDEARDGRRVCAKIPVHEESAVDGRADDRREALGDEREVLEEGIDLLPDVVDWLTVRTGGERREPALVYDHLPGRQLHDWLRTHRPTGMKIDRARSLIARVGRACRALHEAGYVHRYLDPRHVVVDEEGEAVGLVGTGNATPLQRAPNPARFSFDRPAYVAPEARQERSGETLTPRVDVYSLSALAVFVSTGREPRERVESPLGRKAYDRLESLEEATFVGLVRAGIGTLAKERVDDVDAQIGLAEGHRALDVDDFPALPEPWSGPDEVESDDRSLSPGPLVARAGDRDAPPSGADVGDLADAELVDAFDDETEESEAVGSMADEGDEDRRQVSMVDEHLGDPPDEVPEPEEEAPDGSDNSLPPLSELPLKTRVLLGVVLPMALVLGVAALGLLGLY